jgi:hypothetical protein
MMAARIAAPDAKKAMRTEEISVSTPAMTLSTLPAHTELRQPDDQPEEGADDAEPGQDARVVLEELVLS